MHQRLTWDEANNLVRIEDLRDASEWPAGYSTANGLLCGRNPCLDL